MIVVEGRKFYMKETQCMFLEAVPTRLSADVDGGESEVNASSNYSLHLTLAIEVELPFE
jgi:hypothetical protein